MVRGEGGVRLGILAQGLSPHQVTLKTTPTPVHKGRKYKSIQKEGERERRLGFPLCIGTISGWGISHLKQVTDVVWETRRMGTDQSDPQGQQANGDLGKDLGKHLIWPHLRFEFASWPRAEGNQTSWLSIHCICCSHPQASIGLFELHGTDPLHSVQLGPVPPHHSLRELDLFWTTKSILGCVHA